MLSKIYSLLSNLGITANYAGFFYVSHAISLSLSDMENLLLVTKRLYPEIAKHYHTSSKNVERNIRTVIDIAWDNNPQLLPQLAKGSLLGKPTTSEFIAILTMSLFSVEK